MDPNSSDSAVHPTPTASTMLYPGGGAGSGADSSSSVLISSSAPSSSHHIFGKHLFSYPSLFRTTKSCSNLEHLNEESTPSSLAGSNTSLNSDTASIGIIPSRSYTPPPKYTSLFRNIKSCADLEGMDRPDGSPTTDIKADTSSSTEQQTISKQSGLLFGSVKSYLGKSNMVSARDLNIMAPSSS